MRLALGALAAALLLAGGSILAYVLIREHQSRDVRGSSTVEFVPQEPATQKPREPGVFWPTYGFDSQRVRVADGVTLRPPFRRVWRFGARALVEFPPVIAYGRLYFANTKGTVFAINARTGKRAWRRESGRCQAASPAVDRRLIYVTFMRKCPSASKRKDGELVVYWAGSGDVRWRRTIGQSESSPLVHGGYVYVGDWEGRVYSFVAQTGRLAWTFKAGGPVKDSVALSGDRLFFGSYDHHVYALDVRTGKLLWKAAAQARLGPRGTFYSTPAVAYGRVYIGSTDGKVYSLGAASGKLRWSKATGGYVYSSPAVWRQRVYAGSYSRRFYCFDAATGDVLWAFDAGGRISGSPTVIDGVVYFATLEGRTYALDARTGRRRWSFPDGAYTPVVADPERLYIVGEARVYGFLPR